MKREQKGITLIALVITIIVLLILAGISISMLVGDNGVLNKAKNARQNTQRADLVEQARLDISDKQTNNLDSKLKKSELVEVLNKYFNNVSEIENSDDILSETVTSKPEYGTYSVAVKEIYNNGFLDEEYVNPNPSEPEEDKVLFCLVFEFYDIDKANFNSGSANYVLYDYVGETKVNQHSGTLGSMVSIKESAVNGKASRQIQIKYDKDNCPEKIMFPLPWLGQDWFESDDADEVNEDDLTIKFNIDSNESIITRTIKIYY